MFLQCCFYTALLDQKHRLSFILPLGRSLHAEMWNFQKYDKKKAWLYQWGIFHSSDIWMFAWQGPWAQTIYAVTSDVRTELPAGNTFYIANISSKHLENVTLLIHWNFLFNTTFLGLSTKLRIFFLSSWKFLVYKLQFIYFSPQKPYSHLSFCICLAFIQEEFNMLGYNHS